MLAPTHRRPAVAVLAAGVLLAAAAPAHAAFPGRDGRIALHSDRSIYTVAPGGGEKLELPGDAIGFGGLSVASGGMRVVYSASHVIRAVNVDGTDERTLTTSEQGASDAPGYSPDGKRVAFERDYGIWVMNANGSHQRTLTPGSAIADAYYDPAWSPDGQRIAYTHDGQVWVMNADGSGRVDLTPPVLMCPLMTRTMEGSEPDWSPDGSRIVFTGPVTCANSRGSDIWVMNADGSGKSDLVGDDATEDGAPVFSPAGDRIAFTRDDGTGLHVWTMNADGSSPARVATGLYAEDGPDWAAAYTTVRLTEKLTRHGKRLTISGRAKPATRGRVTLTIRRNGRRIARKHATLHHAKYRVRYTPHRPGRYTVVATLPAAAHHLAAASRSRKAVVKR